MTDDQTMAAMRVLSKTNALLGRQGVTFDNSFVSLSLCCPSRSTLLTGQYAHNHGVLGNDLPQGGYEKLDGSNTLAVWLRRRGYYTVHVGKYLNGYGLRNPTEIPPGWSEWHGLVDPTTYRYEGFTINDNGNLSGPAGYQTDILAGRARAVIERRAGKREPFFMWLAFVAPHLGGPNDPGDPKNFGTPSPARQYRGRFATEPLPKPPSFDEADVTDKPRAIRNMRLFTNEQVSAITSNYRQELEALLSVDDAVASIVATLRRTDQLANTLILFTSDNGFFHGEHRIASGKGFDYEPSIRVPLLIRGPGVPRGLHLKQMVANIDIAPTIVAATGARPRRVMDGRSLWPLLRDPALQWGRDLLVERPTSDPQVWAAIRTPRYLYAEYRNGERELYDLATDPNEIGSRAFDTRRRDLVQTLSARLAKLVGCAGPSCRIEPAVALRAGCAGGRVRLSISGPASGSVAHVVFSLRGRVVAAAGPPYARTVGPAPQGAVARATISFVDGRVVTRKRQVTCSR
jgi:N-acetylglucosamine-6-sulfatase